MLIGSGRPNLPARCNLGKLGTHILYWGIAISSSSAAFHERSYSARAAFAFPECPNSPKTSVKETAPAGADALGAALIQTPDG
jgi:hypothetical protein